MSQNCIIPGLISETSQLKLHCQSLGDKSEPTHCPLWFSLPLPSPINSPGKVWPSFVCYQSWVITFPREDTHSHGVTCLHISRSLICLVLSSACQLCHKDSAQGSFFPTCPFPQDRKYSWVIALTLFSSNLRPVFLPFFRRSEITWTFPYN
jgi:hypothetical protein